MKKLIVLACMFLSMQAMAATQPTHDNGDSVNARATALTRTMAQSVQLDEGQYLKIKQLNTRMLGEVDDLKARFSADPELLDKNMADAQARYDSELNSLLRPRQIAAYQQAIMNRTALSIMAN